MTSHDDGSGRRAYPRARKRFGQHFLEPAWVARLVGALNATRDDTFLEIGPGRGALTRPLAARAGHVIAVELDRDLVTALTDEGLPNVRVIVGDVLAVDRAELLADERLPVRVVGNLPYNISSPILFALLHAAADGRVIADATLMLQKEVVDRLAATPGSKDYGALAVQIGLVADVDRLMTLPPGAFRPPPKVTSAVIRLRFRPPSADVGDPGVFERVVRGAFLQRRKTLGNALKPVATALGRESSELIEIAGLDPTRRPETLAIAEFARLARAVL
jgi:16S rRNA (adenine1518-N6/adenine1519-N6)-dimethyltransferase